MTREDVEEGSAGFPGGEARPKVVVVGQGPPATGGIPSYVTNLLRSPAARRAATLGFLNTTPAGERRPGSFTAVNLGRTFQDAAKVFRAAGRAEVVHLNVAAVPLAPLARALLLCAAARAGGARTILHAHTGRLHLATRRRGYRWLLRRSRLVVDVFVVVSRVEAEAARHAGVDPQEVPNGIDATRFRTGPKGDPPVITFVGTVCERKGLLDLLGALSRLRRDSAPPFRVEIVGDASQEGPGEFERVRDAYVRAGLDRTVTFHGALPRHDVDEVLARTAIFCLPSHWEGAPLSLLEAMAAGAAPIASAVGEIPQMLDEGRAGLLVAAGDVEGLADGLRSLLDGADRRSELGLEARRRAIEAYGEAGSFERIADLYRRLAGYSR